MKKKMMMNAFYKMMMVIGGFFALAMTAEAATVYKCAPGQSKCVVTLEEGIIGDHVRVLDEKARLVAYGRIVQRRGGYAVITVANANKEIRKGYPVIVSFQNRGSSLQWASSFTERD